MSHETNAEFVSHGPCLACGSSDANSTYSDGHTYCFSCEHYESGDGSKPSSARPKADKSLLPGEPITRTVRGIRPETFKHWRYTEGETGGKKVHIANHYSNGRLVGQKLRFQGKRFKVLGKLEPLYGEWLWPKGGRRVIVTEGELDALSVSQVQGNKWPVVSLSNGSNSARAAVRKSIQWLESFEEVVLCFDMDEAGQDAVESIVDLFSPGKVKVVSLPGGYKDANEMLVDKREKELTQALWNAQEYRPDGIKSLTDVREEALRPVEQGVPWCWPRLTDLTHGRRLGETYYFGAGTGIGKTDVLMEQILFDVCELKVRTGVLMLEQAPRETVQRLAGKQASKRFHVPDSGWTQDELVSAIDVVDNGNLFLYDNFGSIDWDTVKQNIRYMAVGLQCKHIYLDHLTALAAHADDERVMLEQVTAEIAMLAKELKIIIHVVSHLATPEGKSHEEGGRVTIRHFKGSRAIGFWAHYMFGLERDQQSEDEEARHITTFRVLKDRYTGTATGETFGLRYDASTGRLTQCDDDPFGSHGHPADDMTGDDF